MDGHGEASEGADPLDAVGEDLLLVAMGKNLHPGLKEGERRGGERLKRGRGGVERGGKDVEEGLVVWLFSIIITVNLVNNQSISQSVNQSVDQ